MLLSLLSLIAAIIVIIITHYYNDCYATIITTALTTKLEGEALLLGQLIWMLGQSLVHSLSYSVIPAILAFGIITPTSQIMKMKHREVKVALPKLFHDTHRK